MSALWYALGGLGYILVGVCVARAVVWLWPKTEFTDAPVCAGIVWPIVVPGVLAFYGLVYTARVFDWLLFESWRKKP